MAEVKCQHLVKSYKTVEVIKDFDMTIQDGEFVTLVGPSGCGKSTLLRAIAGLEEITAGELFIDGQLANNTPAKDRGIAMVFQSYALFPHMTVAANVGFGLKIKKVPEAEKHAKIEKALKLLHLEGLGDRQPRELSGGQRQRVAIGRSLVLDPKVLLLDEPLSNLDAKLRLKMRTEFKRIHKSTGHTIIYVTHDQVEAMTLSDRIAILQGGYAQQIGSPMEVFNHPANAFVAGFIGSPPINFIPVTLASENNTFVLKAESFRLGLGALEPAAQEKIKACGLNEFTLGIRPQDMYLPGDQAVHGLSDNLVQTRVDVTEPIGEHVVVVVAIGPHTVKATLPNDTGCKADDTIELAINTRSIHLFDPTTEKAIF
jgi:multiple sugar transport system ATP-binding protein